MMFFRKVHTLGLICVSLIYFMLTGCASTVTTSSKTISSDNQKLTRLNVIYVDDLHNAKSTTKGIGNSERTYDFVVRLRKNFAAEVLNAIPVTFKTYGIEAKADLYKFKKNSDIRSADIAKMFPDSKEQPLLVISPIKIDSQCSDSCFYDMTVSAKLIHIDSNKLIWSSSTNIETKLQDRLKFISTSENAKQFVKKTVEQMKADNLF